MKKAQADEKAESLVYDFFKKKEKFRYVENKFKEAKSDFYAAMEKLFDDSDDCKIFDHYADSFVVKKIEKVSVEFNAKKLKNRLKKSQFEKVVSKRYVVDDADGFLMYLKECGCDPAVLRDFIRTEFFVDKKALDMLFDIGDISKDDVDGCYTVKKSKPYFTVDRERDVNDGKRSE